MRGIISYVIAASLFAAGSSARAAAGDDDKYSRPSEKSSALSGKKPIETGDPATDSGSNLGNPGKPAPASPALDSEVQQLRQLVQEQADRLRGLQQRLADFEGEAPPSKPPLTN